jgi:virulence-associated protein VagC
MKISFDLIKFFGAKLFTKGLSQVVRLSGMPFAFTLPAAIFLAR